MRHSGHSRSVVQRGALALGPAMAILCYCLLPDSFETGAGEVVAFSHAGRATLGVLVWMAVWWFTEAIDIAATALLPLVAFPLLGVAKIDAAAAPYGSDIVFLFLGGFLMALSMQRWGLDRRIALFTLRLVGTKPANMVGGFMLATACISAFVSNTATAAMMLPIAISVIALVRPESRADEPASRPSDERESRRLATCLVLGVAYAASIGGVITLIGTPPNGILQKYIESGIAPAFQRPVAFVDWLPVGIGLAIVFLPLAWLLLTKVLFPIRMTALPGGQELLGDESRSLGHPKPGEWITLIVFLGAGLLWVLRPFIAPLEITVGGDSIQPLAGLSDAGIAIGAGLLLFILPAGRGAGPTLDWRTAEKLPWGVLILFGGGLSLAKAMEVHGVAEFFGSHARAFEGVPMVIVILVTVATIVFLSEFASNTAVAAALVPVLGAVAPGLGLHPYPLVIAATLAASCAFMMPVGTPPNAMAFATGHVTMREMCRAGLWLNLLAIGLITALATWIVPAVFGG